MCPIFFYQKKNIPSRCILNSTRRKNSFKSIHIKTTIENDETFFLKKLKVLLLLPGSRVYIIENNEFVLAL